MNEILEAIKSKSLKEVFFGSRGFSIADEASIEDLQLGYSMHPDGSDLSGSNEDDWQKSWIVIGTDTEVGDPFFVDANEPSLPVYTAMHGMGEWNAELVSTSLSSFLEALVLLNNINNQDFAKIKPDENTIADSSQIAVIAEKLQEISGERYYWQNFIEQYQQWVEEYRD